jgi:hypothetical protein
MNMKNKYNNHISKNNASVLIVVVFAIALLTAFVAGMLQLNAEQIQLMRNEVYAAQAQAIAEAGIADAFSQLRKDSSWTKGYQDQKFGNGSYTVTVTTSPVLTVESVGTSSQGFIARVQANVTIGGASVPYVVRVDKLRINE